MNTLSIIIMSLNTALVALRTVEGFITDPKVRSIMEEVAKAIEYGLSRLHPYQRAAQDAATHGKPVPATAPREGAAASEPKDSCEGDEGEGGEEGDGADEDEDMNS